MNVLALSFQAGFRCERSGACCTSAWPIPVEVGRLPVLREAVAAGRLSFTLDEAEAVSPFVEPPSLPAGAGAVLRTRASGACAFYERDRGLCAIQRALGHDHLPSACQHFPRRCLIEADRIAVSLSHYCPTVARLTLDEAGSTLIVSAPESLVGHMAIEGLDARGALPPLLKPGLLTDLTGYRTWERVVLEILTVPLSPESALAEIAAFTERVRAWRPRDGTLCEAVERAAPERGIPSAEVRHAQDQRQRASQLAGAFEVVRASVPPGIATLPPADRLDAADARWVTDGWPLFSSPLRRFLAAHAFGSWCAYNGMGLRTVVRSLEAALAVVRVEAARQCAAVERPLDEPILVEAMRGADLLLVHLADPAALASRLSVVEEIR